MEIRGRIVRYSVLISLVGIFNSCEVPDQTIILPEHKNVAIPTPDARDFMGNNQKHKVLVSIFDQGIDYNHPELKDHIHFDLNEQGQPVGLGHDYLANSTWTTHRFVNTRAYKFEQLPPAHQKEALEDYHTAERYNESVKDMYGNFMCTVSEAIKIDPRLERFFHPYRSPMLESSEGTHGTHVAGLMTYDQPEIGIVPYRVLPYHQTKQDRIDFSEGKADRFVKNLEDAIQDASNRGVRVVNFSLGGSFTQPDDTSDTRAMKQFERFRRMITDKMSDVLKQYPQILFVAATGNSTGWSDNLTNVQYPCGIESDNLLCVGALTYDGRLTRFTNIPLNRVTSVFAAGTDIVSLAPSDQCPLGRNILEDVLQSGYGRKGLCREDKQKDEWVPDDDARPLLEPLAKSLYDNCNHKLGMYREMSGTSMATPLVTRLATQVFLEKPYLSAAQVIEQIKRKAKVEMMGQFTAMKLKVDRPSWYSYYKNVADARGMGVVFNEDQQDKSEELISVIFSPQRILEIAKKASQGLFVYLGYDTKEALDKSSKNAKVASKD